MHRLCGAALSPRRGRNSASVGQGLLFYDFSKRGADAFPLLGERVRVRAVQLTNCMVPAKLGSVMTTAAVAAGAFLQVLLGRNAAEFKSLGDHLLHALL
jgi:hypothetical protein